MSDIAVKVENLSKLYHIGARQEQYPTLRSALVSGMTRLMAKRSDQEIGKNILWALKDVSFEIKQSEVVGIIGRNGAGKSTLLKVLAHITEPTRGRVSLYGRVGSLLEVATGFHPELTGRDNIYLNGAILGMKRAEIRSKFDEIVDFAEIESLLDTPVKKYSSGMYVRLAFAVAAHLEPDILVVDEVLAVGDGEFQKKSLGKMDDVSKSGRTVLLVSHQMNVIRSLCHQTLLLSKGEILAYGKTDSVISQYLSSSKTIEWESKTAKENIASPYFSPQRMRIVDENLNPFNGIISADQLIGVLIEGEIERFHQAITIGFVIYASTGELLFCSEQTDVEKENWPQLRIGENKIVGWIPPHLLNEGDYRIELSLSLYQTEWICKPSVNAPVVGFQIRGGLSKSPHWLVARRGLNAPILKFEVLN